MTIGVYGATGWIGSALVELLRLRGVDTRLFGRRPGSGVTVVPDRPTQSHLVAHFEGLDAVINVAGLAHVQNGATGSELWVNTELPALIVASAEEAAVRRVVHLSSIKAASEGGPTPVTATDVPRPTTIYGESKRRGEEQSRRLARDVELVVLRPPLVLGAGAPGNFGRLEALVRRGIPVPLPRPYARRSVVVRQHLVDLLRHLATTAQSPAEVVHAAEDEVPTTRDLVMIMKSIHLSSSIVVPVPIGVCSPLLRLVGRGEDVNRLTQDLVVEPTRGREIGGWEPPAPLAVALRRELMRAAR